MILTGREIEEQVNSGNIAIKPFDAECIKPNSYVYHLGDTLVEVLDVGDKKRKPKTRKIKIPQKGYVLEPKRLYLGTTVETFILYLKRNFTGRVNLLTIFSIN